MDIPATPTRLCDEQSSLDQSVHIDQSGMDEGECAAGYETCRSLLTRIGQSARVNEGSSIPVFGIQKAQNLMISWKSGVQTDPGETHLGHIPFEL